MPRGKFGDCAMTDKFILCFVLLFCGFANIASGQNAAQILEKYGQPVEAYSISERIWMTPEFAADGQVCKVRLYPKRISETTNFFLDKLDYWELNKVINQLPPLETRGKPSRL